MKKKLLVGVTLALFIGLNSISCVNSESGIPQSHSLDPNYYFPSTFNLRSEENISVSFEITDGPYELMLLLLEEDEYEHFRDPDYHSTVYYLEMIENVSSGSFFHEVTETGDFVVVFINQGDSTIIFNYDIRTEEFSDLYVYLIAFGIIAVGIVSFIIWRISKKKRMKELQKQLDANQSVTPVKTPLTAPTTIDITLKCSQCGHELRSDEIFCPVCGTKRI